jgi:hypothetical protein
MTSIKVLRANHVTDAHNMVVGSSYYAPLHLPQETAAKLVADGFAEAVTLAPFAGSGITLKRNLSAPNLPRSFFAGEFARVPADIGEDLARHLLDTGNAVAHP